MISIAGVVIGAWASVVASVEAFAVGRAFTRRQETPPRGTLDPPDPIGAAHVLVARPCAGDVPWLGRSLASIATARRSFSMSSRIAVASTSDGAYGVALASAQALSSAGLDVSVVVTEARGPNGKASQLASVVAAEVRRPDVVIVADSDVDLDDADLDALVAPLLEGTRVAAVWAPPVESGPAATLGDRASMAVLAGSLHAFPLLAGIDRAGLVGKLFAVRRDALEAVGGFDALASYLGEDMELARRLRAARYDVGTTRVVARSLACGRSWEHVEARFARWILVIRAQRPALLPTYPLLFFPTLPVAVAAAIVFSGTPAIGAVVACGAIVTRLAVAVGAAHYAGRRLSGGAAVVDALLGDAMLAAAFVRALRSRRVRWGDATLEIDRTGKVFATTAQSPVTSGRDRFARSRPA